LTTPLPDLARRLGAVNAFLAALGDPLPPAA